MRGFFIRVVLTSPLWWLLWRYTEGGERYTALLLLLGGWVIVGIPKKTAPASTASTPASSSPSTPPQ